jgi:hypothetical protein
VEEEAMERSPELEEVIAGWFQSLTSGDGSWVDRHVSRDAGVVFVGTDPNEWLDGERAGAYLKSAVEALDGSVRFSPGEPVAHCEGNVGWGRTRPTVTLPDGRELNPRWSGVFRQEGGDWKAVQIHASVGIPNDELFGMKLPADR